MKNNYTTYGETMRIINYNSETDIISAEFIDDFSKKVLCKGLVFTQEDIYEPDENGIFNFKATSTSYYYRDRERKQYYIPKDNQ